MLGSAKQTEQGLGRLGSLAAVTAGEWGHSDLTLGSADCQHGLSSVESCREPGRGSANTGVCVICPFRRESPKSRLSSVASAPASSLSMYTLLGISQSPLLKKCEDAFQVWALCRAQRPEGQAGFTREGRAGAEWKPGVN